MFNEFSVVITMLHSGIHLPKLGYILFPKSRGFGGKLRQNEFEELLDTPVKKSYPTFAVLVISSS
jgi:hypothetical protein